MGVREAGTNHILRCHTVFSMEQLCEGHNETRRSRQQDIIRKMVRKVDGEGGVNGQKGKAGVSENNRSIKRDEDSRNHWV